MRNPTYKDPISEEVIYVGSLRAVEYIEQLHRDYNKMTESRDTWRTDSNILSYSNEKYKMAIVWLSIVCLVVLIPLTVFACSYLFKG